MKTKKHFLFLMSPISIVVGSSLVISCSNTNVNSFNNELEKKQLNEFIGFKLENDGFNSTHVNVNDEYKNAYVANGINLFNILDDQNLASNIFKIDSELYEDENIEINYSFSYDVVDSFGNNAKPYVSNDKRIIVIPVLVTLINTSTYTSASKYVDFFNLSIVDSIVDNNSSEDVNNNFNGTKGKRIIFKEIKFQTLPNIIIDEYLTLNKFYNDKIHFIKPAKYNLTNKWKNKTLSEVKSISNAISSPNTVLYDEEMFNYSIIDSIFDIKEEEYARFTFSVTPNLVDSSLSSQAKDIYGVNFTKEYSYLDKRWKFKKPNSSDIESMKTKNSSLASDLTKTIENAKFSHVPIVNISPFEVENKTIESIIETSNKKGSNYFLPPQGYTYTILDDNTREIWFEVTNLESIPEFPTQIKINMNLNVERGKLLGNSSFSKTFDTKTWKFV